MKLATEPCDRCHGTGKQPNQILVGASLRRARENAGMSLRDMARALNISAPFLSDLERGRRNWDSDRIAAYREALP